MIFRTLNAGELDAWCSHCQGVFTQTPDGYFKRHYEFDPDADANLVFIAEDEGQTVSTVRVFRRVIRVGGRQYTMGGIGEVSTKPAWRGKGLASELLNRAIDAMRREKMDCSILFGNRNIYFKAGYQTMYTRYTLAEVSSLPDAASDAVIRPFEMRDLDAVMGIYDLYAGRMDTALLRSQAYWKMWVLPQWEHVWVLEKEGRAVAYCQMNQKGGIGEMGAAPQFEEALPALLKGAALQMGAERIRFQSGWLPEVSGETEENPLYMILPFNEMEKISCPGFCGVDGF